MDFFEAVENRHSYRGDFSKEDIRREDLIKIVSAGAAAPSGKNAQTTEFIIVDDGPLVNKIQSMPKANKAMASASAYIACLIDLDPEKIYEGYSFQIEDCAAAVENMLLAITALGYGSVWVDGWLRVDDRAKTIANELAVPKDKKIQVILPIGKPIEEAKRVEKKPLEERIKINGYK